ncbi:baseplate J/gp47 family protein [Achromobacter denitrificans]|uniref:Baseplate J/gp47 family protein n=1 Tax=Achromobacter denitrificans TaxID=32002 RepID=A0A6N0JMW1_ACHDE|nr:baseplate J/gp47 family protein [Achromobacter denitrificans]QKQ48481.1 baseplate J/gp47 family protein [Achromobacter denitrificans]
MPFSRPTLSELRNQVLADINATLDGANALLRKAVLRVLGVAQAGLAHLHFGYIDWISMQAVPWTATDEYLAGWGAMKNVFRKDAVAAVITAQFTGTAGVVISAGIEVKRADGTAYTVEETQEVGADGKAAVVLRATATGAAGNCSAGTPVTLSSTITGLQSTGTVVGAIATGADVEPPDAYSERVIAAYQETPHGGNADDYVRWALAVPGVSRAWCSPNGMGAGTVVLRFMMDTAQSQHGGFPQGANGISQHDLGPDGLPRAAVATGDQLVLADALIGLQPVTALVFACAPVDNSLHFKISGLSGAGTATRNAISAALADVLFRTGDARGGTINRNDIEGAINSVSGASGWLLVEVAGTVDGVVTVYPGNVTNGIGQLPTLGGVTYL